VECINALGKAAESLNTVIEAAEAVIANPSDPEALTILLEARAKRVPALQQTEADTVRQRQKSMGSRI